MVIRGLSCSLVLALLSGCAGIPKDEIQVFTDSYAAVDEAGRAVYAEYETMVTRGPGIRPPTAVPSRFGVDFTDYLVDQYREPEPTEQNAQVAARFAAMDAMLVFNDGLTAVVKGRGEDELRSVLAPLETLAAAATGGATAPLKPVLDLVVKGVSEAQSRTALVTAMTAEIDPVTTTGPDGMKSTYQGHPADVLLQALEDDARDMNTAVIGRVSSRALKLQEKFGDAPTDDRGKNLYFALYEDAERALEAIRNYRALLAHTRVYFAKLRAAATGEGTIVSAEFVEFVIDLRAEARSVLDQL